MHAMFLAALAAATLGVDVGWQPAADGGLEYIIQIEPETLEQLRAGQELAVGIRPELRDVRRYRIIVGNGPLPREALRPQAADFSTESDLGEAAPAVATEVNPYRTPSYSDANTTARPDLLAQANTAGADPISARYSATGNEAAVTGTPRFVTPSRYATTPGLTAAETSTNASSTATPSASATNGQAYDWFSERFGGAGSINVPLLYTTSEPNNTAATNPASQGWSSANPSAGSTNGSAAASGTPIAGLPNPPGNDPRYGSVSNSTNDPRYGTSGTTSGPVLNPPNDMGMSPINRPVDSSATASGPQWPAGNYPTAPGYGTNPYTVNNPFPVAPAPTAQQGNPNYPYAGGNPYVASQQNPYANQAGYPQQGPQQSQFGQGAPNTPAGLGTGLADNSLPTFGQGTALDPSRSANAPVDPSANKESENKPWAFLIMTLFGLFASMGLNLYLGWNFYDARLRYLDLLDSLRRRGAGRAGSGSTTSSRIGGSDLAERYSAA